VIELARKNNPVIRLIRKEEVSKATELLARLKRLNGEFDPLLKTSDSLEEEAKLTLEQAMEDRDSIVLVAVDKAKVVGLVKGVLSDRVFYEPRKEGAIVEFYILPEYRRRTLGKELISEASLQLKKRGAELITAEFPSQNEIAKNFYDKLGFRSLTNVYAKAE
jgi:ribosomal protein S18 acetylase RimI-like enzyme